MGKPLFRIVGFNHLKYTLTLNSYYADVLNFNSIIIEFINYDKYHCIQKTKLRKAHCLLSTSKVYFIIYLYYYGYLIYFSISTHYLPNILVETNFRNKPHILYYIIYKTYYEYNNGIPKFRFDIYINILKLI